MPDCLAQIPIAFFGHPPQAVERLLRNSFPLCTHLTGAESGAAETGRVRGLTIFGTHDSVGGAIFDCLPALEIVANCGVGVDHIDITEAIRRGIVVTNTPDVLTDDVADLAIGLLLQTVRQLSSAERFLRAGKWHEGSYPLTDTLQGKTVGILGLGRIGKAIARRLAAFGVKLAYHGRSQQVGVDLAFFHSPRALAEACDIIIVAMPGGPGTNHLVDAQVIHALGPTGILVNVARGSVIDEPALIEALRNGQIAAAGLDVFESEPDIAAPLLALDNVVLLPHVGSGTHRTRLAMGQLVIDNLIGHFGHEGALTPVCPS